MSNHYSQIHTPPALPLWQGALIHTGGWMGHVAGHHVLEKRKISSLARNWVVPWLSSLQSRH